MKHKHYDKILAKAANMDLVVFCKGVNNDCEWHEIRKFPNWQSNAEYFLCLPQHKDACLHWLNGGHLDFNSEFMGEWTEYKPFKIWRAGSVFMQEDYKIRIKPNKEKRWMIYSERPFSIEVFGDESVCDTVFSSQLPTENKQKIEIEVEV